MSRKHLVYSTDRGRLCSNCGNPPMECICQSQIHVDNDGFAKLQRQVKGRNGKPVTLISGLQLADSELKTLAKELKKRCGVGGSIEGRDILIQGDKRDILKDVLQKKGYQVKLSGG